MGGSLTALITMPPLILAGFLLLQNTPLLVTALALVPLTSIIVKLDDIVSGDAGPTTTVIIAGAAILLAGSLLGSPYVELIGLTMVGASLLLSLWTSLFKVGTQAYEDAKEEGHGSFRSVATGIGANFSALYGSTKQAFTDAYESVAGLFRREKELQTA